MVFFICVISLLEVITRHYSSILRRFVVMEQRVFGIGAIHYTADTRLSKSLGTRLGLSKQWY